MIRNLSNSAGGTTVETSVRSAGLCARTARRLRSLPTDDRGQMTLLAAMMSFLVVMLTAMGVYTNIAFHRRITTQNAVDSAAEAAALWQARACNVVQALNNLHYRVNQVAGYGEVGAAASCVIALVPWLKAACIPCATLPLIDAGQQRITILVTNTQQLVVDATPFLAFLAANATAKGSGADGVGEAVPGAVRDWLDAVGSGIRSDLGGYLSESGVGRLLGELENNPVLGAIPVYAAPLSISSLGLHAKLKKGTGFPWKFTDKVGIVGDKVGRGACPGLYTSAYQTAVGLRWDEKWGWKDSYFFGNPGYMTWIAGKKSPEDFLGLSKMVWMQGGRKDLNSIDRHYTGDYHGAELRVPAFLGIASSQVEGTPIVSHGDTDAKGKLIKVYFSEKFPGSSVGILH